MEKAGIGYGVFGSRKDWLTVSVEAIGIGQGCLWKQEGLIKGVCRSRGYRSRVSAEVE